VYCVRAARARNGGYGSRKMRYYVIGNDSTNLVLTVSNASVTNNTPVLFYPWQYAANQQWRPALLPNGYYEFVVHNSGRRLYVPKRGKYRRAPTANLYLQSIHRRTVCHEQRFVQSHDCISRVRGDRVNVILPRHLRSSIRADKPIELYNWESANTDVKVANKG
jgi:Ricin-type beta-trefoil lectin domain-like